jgi:hypothetical protein
MYKPLHHLFHFNSFLCILHLSETCAFGALTMGMTMTAVLFSRSLFKSAKNTEAPQDHGRLNTLLCSVIHYTFDRQKIRQVHGARSKTKILLS